MYISYGTFVNNIIGEIEDEALWNVSVLPENPIVIDYNCIWDYGELMDRDGFNLGNNNLINVDPMFNEGTFTLQELSPCRNSGDPNLEDLDGKRPDIGVYGGPYAY